MKRSFFQFMFVIAVAIVYLGGLIILFYVPRNYGFGSDIISFLGLILGFFGIVIWTLGFFTLGKSFNILPEPLDLVNAGIYRYISHPIYLGIDLFFLGLSLAIGSLFSLFYTLLILIPFNYYRSQLENKSITKRLKK